MEKQAVRQRDRIVLGIFLTVVSLLMWSTSVWATTQVGKAELQLWYRQRNTFQTDGGKHVQWVQWRHELFGWLVYEKLIEDGKLFDQIKVPFVEEATFNVRYRFRADPVFSVRDHYERLYDRDERDSLTFPENGVRDLFVDLSLGKIGPGRLSIRAGNQQIVWGESDLFRSLDIINPLRIDQNQAVGEKFDEFRSPIMAIKFLYDMGTVGEYLSNVAIEPFYTPRFRTGLSDLILDGILKLPHHARGCFDDNNRLVRYDSVRCAQPRADGTRVFEQYRPGWLPQRRLQNPFGLFSRSGNAQAGSRDYLCLNPVCSPDVFGHRASFIPNIRQAREEGALNGIMDGTQAAGVRFLATTRWGVDFSLNYIFLPSGPDGQFDVNKILSGPGGPPAPFRGDTFFGDPGSEVLLGLPPGTPLAGSFQEGLRRCLSDGGKTSEGKSKDRAGRVSTVLLGADLLGYDNPDRFGPNGALQANGNAKPGKHQSSRPPITFCLPAVFDYHWTHVPGFTATYNDFQYTGAILRLEQSYSTKEVIRRYPELFDRRRDDPATQNLLENNFNKFTAVWRSMVGFDLFKSIPLFKYIPGIHPSFYNQAWFLTGQWLMEHYSDNVANNICSNHDNIGGVTKDMVREFEAANPGLRAYENSQCRRYRWNHLFTLALATNGLFGSRLETRNAVAFEPRDQQYLLYTQNWWRSVFGIPALELSFGAAWYPGSSLGESWSSLNHFADRDQFWFEFTYYLL